MVYCVFNLSYADTLLERHRLKTKIIFCSLSTVVQTENHIINTEQLYSCMPHTIQTISLLNKLEVDAENN